MSLENEDQLLQQLYKEVDAAFVPLKAILDKYPNSFTLDYHPKDGYYAGYE